MTSASEVVRGKKADWRRVKSENDAQGYIRIKYTKMQKIVVGSFEMVAMAAIGLKASPYPCAKNSQELELKLKK